MSIPTGEQKVFVDQHEAAAHTDQQASTPQRAQSPNRASLDSHHQPTNVVLHSPLPPPQNKQFVLSTSGPQTPGMPIILAPRPLADKESNVMQSAPEGEDISLKMASTHITGEVPDKETKDTIAAAITSENDEPISAEKMPKIMTNTVYDI